MIRSIKTFDISDNPRAVLHRDLLAVEVLSEGDVRSIEVLELLQRIKNFLHRATAVAQSIVFEADLRAHSFVGLQSRLIDHRQPLRRPAMNKLSAQLDCFIAHMPRPDAPADAV